LKHNLVSIGQTFLKQIPVRVILRRLLCRKLLIRHALKQLRKHAKWTLPFETFIESLLYLQDDIAAFGVSISSFGFLQLSSSTEGSENH
jgi:hypothetical protein